MAGFWLWESGEVSFDQDAAMESIQIADTQDGDVIVFTRRIPSGSSSCLVTATSCMTEGTTFSPPSTGSARVVSFDDSGPSGTSSHMTAGNDRTTKQ